MSDAEPPQNPPKKSRKPLIIGVFSAVLLGAAGFYASYTGLVLAAPAPAHEPVAHHSPPDPVQAALPRQVPAGAVAYVALPSMIISLPQGTGRGHLKFTAQLETPPEAASEVEAHIPRVLDVLNGYLRAVDVSTFEDPGVLSDLRKQMLRRVQVVVGVEAVRDFLVTEFVLN